MQKKQSIRIELEQGDKVALRSVALNEDRSLKNFIERELIAMGSKGLSYLDLLTQYETTAQKLREVTK